MFDSFQAHPPKSLLLFLHQATIDGKIVGAAVNRITTEGSKRVGNIGMVGVLPEYRKRGIGRALCIKTLDLFKEHGIKEVYLETEVHNYNALALYEVCCFFFFTFFGILYPPQSFSL